MTTPQFSVSPMGRYSMIAFDGGPPIEYNLPSKTDAGALAYAKDEAQFAMRKRLVLRAPDGRIVYEGAA